MFLFLENLTTRCWDDPTGKLFLYWIKFSGSELSYWNLTDLIGNGLKMIPQVCWINKTHFFVIRSRQTRRTTSHDTLVNVQCASVSRDGQADAKYWIVQRSGFYAGSKPNIILFLKKSRAKWFTWSPFWIYTTRFSRDGQADAKRCDRDWIFQRIGCITNLICWK